MPDENRPDTVGADANQSDLSAEDYNEIVRIRREKLQELKDAGQDPFLRTTFDRDASNAEIVAQFDALEGKDVTVAGRMMSKRNMGKASFIDVYDATGRMQVYVRINDVGEESYAGLKKWDIGDIIGVKGTVFRTKRGEISLHAREITLLSKSLLPLPEKFHGLKDTELRYRQRYLDLIMNPEVKETFVRRSAIIASMRNYLVARGFIEVETPILNVIPGGATARPFITHHNTLNIDLYLRIAPELYLKRLIVGGMEKVFEIGRLFRNEGMDIKHNPEFTNIELYQAYTDYNGMMRLTEEMVAHIAKEVLGSTVITYQGETIDLTPPWRRMTMLDAVKEFCGVDFLAFRGDTARGRAEAQKLGVEVAEGKSWGEAMYAVFDEKVEGQLAQPTFILDYPVEVSPLTKRKPDMPELTERFELFITRRELANAYSELNDPIDQRERLVRQAKLREAGDLEADMMDEDFVTSMEYGMPPTGGLGIGLDRLIMLLTDSYSIRDVLLFPTMKPRD